MNVRRMLTLVGAVLMLGCVGDAGTSTPDSGGTEGGVVDSGAGDGGASVDAGTDAATGPCNAQGAFGAPQLVAGINTTDYEGLGSFSPDELKVYIGASRPTDAGISTDLFVASRPDLTSSFASPVLLANVNSVGAAPYGYDDAPSVSADGLTLAFTTVRQSGAGGYDLFIATRSSTGVDFGTPVPLTGLNTNSAEINAHLTADGTEIWFTSNRNGGFDFFRASRSGTSTGAPAPVAELNTPSDDNAPVLSADGLTIFFASKRSDGNAKGDNDIWVARRPTKGSSFGAPMNVAELNTNKSDIPGWVSTNDCRLYFYSNRGGSTGFDIYVAERPKN